MIQFTCTLNDTNQTNLTLFTLNEVIYKETKKKTAKLLLLLFVLSATNLLGDNEIFNLKWIN